jgi:para-nitrobenzyl esterase
VAKGLFHRASIQSGSGLRQAEIETSQKLTHATLAELGIAKRSIGKLHTDFTFRQLVEAGMVGQQKAAAGIAPSQPGMRGMNWGPVVDGELIPRHTWDPVAPDSSANVPLIVGTVLNESFNSVQMGDASLERMDMTEAKSRLKPLMGSYTDHVAEIARRLYPNASPFEIFSRAAATRQRLNACRQAELKTKQGGAPAYLYRFDWQSPSCDGRARAFHTSELPFCFHNSELCGKLTGNTPESHLLASRIARSWAAFAESGNPNHPGIPRWEPFNENIPTMIFDKECILMDDPDGELCNAVSQTMR